MRRLPLFAHAWRELELALTFQWIHLHRHATFAALAGVSTADTGPVPPDGYNVWPALASGGSVPSPRTFIIHEYDELEGIYAYRSVRLQTLSRAGGYCGNIICDDNLRCWCGVPTGRLEAELGCDRKRVGVWVYS